VRKRVTMLPAVVGGVLLAVAGCGGGSSSPSGSAAGPAEHPTKLLGDVGKGGQFVISLTDQDGKKIKHLAAGTYPVEVNDESSIHNFHLTGPGGVDQSTDVGGKGTKTFQVTFSPGTYTFVCDPHAGTMRGSFTVS
jgi:hypothetical protein